jgi:hypothetical protein
MPTMQRRFPSSHDTRKLRYITLARSPQIFFEERLAFLLEQAEQIF